MQSSHIMIIAIITIVMIASVLKARYKARHGILEDEDGNQRLAADPDIARLRDDVRALKERIAVLERLATDNNRAVDLDREIDKLRLGDR
ncbi:MAG: hypothetical protein ACKVOP_09040 [Sphingomonadaceae bacterium]